MKQEEKDFRDRKVKDFIQSQVDIKSGSVLRTAFKLGWNLSHRYSRDKNKNGSLRVKKV